MENSHIPSPSTADHSDNPRGPSNSESSSREAVLARRSHRLKQLVRIYRDYYWSLMEELRAKHSEYYWKYGKSPFVEGEVEAEEQEDGGWIGVDDQENRRANRVTSGLNGDNTSCGDGNRGGEKLVLGFRSGASYRRCAFPGCKSKAMTLTSYCHPHILCDSKQVLYKGCKFAVKSGPTGPVLCQQPVLRSNQASLCPMHFQRNEKNVSKALKKAGLGVAASAKFSSKFHLLVKEYIHHIQAKRRDAMKDTANDLVDEECSNPFIIRQGKDALSKAVDDMVMDEDFLDPFFFRKVVDGC